MVSIIIPVYQVSDYIERCLSSVLGQSYNDLECIIVDDSTRDDSIIKCERLIAAYNDNKKGIRFRILHHDRNRGLSAARNTGADAATGDWLFYIDADDEITHDCIEKLASIAQAHPDAEMVLGNTDKHFQDGHVTLFISQDMPTAILTNTEVFNLYQQRRLLVNAWNILIRRSFFKQHQLYFREGILYEDRLWLFYVVKVLSKLYICKDVTYHYYVRPGSITTDSAKQDVGKSYSIIYDEILHHLTPGGERAELNYYVEMFCRHYLEHEENLTVYNSLMKEYRKYSWVNSCWSAYSKLWFASAMGALPFGLFALRKLQEIKMSIKR